MSAGCVPLYLGPTTPPVGDGPRTDGPTGDTGAPSTGTGATATGSGGTRGSAGTGTGTGSTQHPSIDPFCDECIIGTAIVDLAGGYATYAQISAAAADFSVWKAYSTSLDGCRAVQAEPSTRLDGPPTVTWRYGAKSTILRPAPRTSGKQIYEDVGGGLAFWGDSLDLEMDAHAEVIGALDVEAFLAFPRGPWTDDLGLGTEPSPLFLPDGVITWTTDGVEGDFLIVQLEGQAPSYNGLECAVPFGRGRLGLDLDALGPEYSGVPLEFTAWRGTVTVTDLPLEDGGTLRVEGSVLEEIVGFVELP